MDEDAHTFLQAEPLISARTQMSCLIWNSGAIPIRQYATMMPWNSWHTWHYRLIPDASLSFDKTLVIFFFN